MTAKIKLNAASGGGSFSLQAPSSSANNRVMTLPDSADGTILTTTNPKAGNTIQVVSTTKTSFFSTTTTGSLVDVTGVSVTITPSSSSNKILVSCTGEYGNGNNDSFASLFLARTIGGGTVNGDIAIGDARGSTTRATMNASLRSGGGLSDNVTRSFGCEFLDSPNTTNAIIYKLRIFVVQGTPACIGGANSTNYNNYVSVPTFITAKEIAE